MKLNEAIWYIEEVEKSHNFSATESVAWQTLKAAVLAQQPNNDDYTAALKGIYIWREHTNGEPVEWVRLSDVMQRLNTSCIA